jgi:hypothetical protein
VPVTCVRRTQRGAPEVSEPDLSPSLPGEGTGGGRSTPAGSGQHSWGRLASLSFLSLFRYGEGFARDREERGLLGFGLAGPAAGGQTEGEALCFVGVVLFRMAGSLACTSRHSRGGTIYQSFCEMFLSGVGSRRLSRPNRPSRKVTTYTNSQFIEHTGVDGAGEPGGTGGEHFNPCRRGC